MDTKAAERYIDEYDKKSEQQLQKNTRDWKWKLNSKNSMLYCTQSKSK